MAIADNLTAIRADIPEHVELVAVSKTHPVELIMEAYNEGQRAFGENKVQELTTKAPEMPDDIQWHLIGHLQTNKVKYIIEIVHLIHSVDSFKLLREIEKRAKNKNRVVNCLLQLHIAEESSKFGLDEDELFEIITSEEFSGMEHVKVKGLMGMATFTDDESQVKREFEGLKAVFGRAMAEVPASGNWTPEILSMGMSGDYKLAIECGSNMVRVGSAIFGARNYNAG